MRCGFAYRTDWIGPHHTAQDGFKSAAIPLHLFLECCNYRHEPVGIAKVGVVCKGCLRAGEIAQWVKTLAAKSNDLSFLPRANMVEGEK